MATLNNRGQFDCLAKLQANPDMEFFMLLASDKLTSLLIDRWADLAEAEQLHSPEKIAEARACAERVRQWRQSQGLPLA